MVTSPNLFDCSAWAGARARLRTPNEVGPGPPEPDRARRTSCGTGSAPIRRSSARDVRLNGQRVHGHRRACRRTSRSCATPACGAPQRADAYTTFGVNLADAKPDGGAYVGADSRAARRVARGGGGRGRRRRPGHRRARLQRPRPEAVSGRAQGRPRVAACVPRSSCLACRRRALAAGADGEPRVGAAGARGAARARVRRLARARRQRRARSSARRSFEGGLLGLVGGAPARWSRSGARARWSRSRRSTCRAARRSRSTGAIAAVVVGAGALLGLLAAMAPATWAARATLSSLLASSAVRGGGGHGRMRRGMVVAQVALSLVLLSSGGLVVRSFERLLRADPGFSSERRADDARAGCRRSSSRSRRTPSLSRIASSARWRRFRA